MKREVTNRSTSAHHTPSNIHDSHSQTALRISFTYTQSHGPCDQAAQSTTYHVPPAQQISSLTHPVPSHPFVTIDTHSGSSLYQHPSSIKFQDPFPPRADIIPAQIAIDSISGHGLLEQQIYHPQVSPSISTQMPCRSMSPVYNYELQGRSLVETDHRWAIINPSAPLNATPHPAQAPPWSNYFINKDMKVFYTEQGTNKLLGQLKLYNTDSKTTSDRKPQCIDCVHLDKHSIWQDITQQWNLCNGINNMLVPHPAETDAYLTWAGVISQTG
ncbi:hypothetical protein IMY05_C4626000200 [Salix suchowensis]|nr:hypothetical protein IMY05_C4626000200 [Salix suchowensis]